MTNTLTLPDFLLARIAEDRVTLLRRAVSATTLAGQMYPERAVAECEAKRRIVDAATDDMALYDHVFKTIRPTDAEDYTSGAVWGLTYALRALAAVYADHPDYRPEWRP